MDGDEEEEEEEEEVGDDDETESSTRGPRASDFSFDEALRSGRVVTSIPVVGNKSTSRVSVAETEKVI